MVLLTITLLCVLASSKVTIQGMFAKKNIKSVADGVFFNGLIFLFAAILFLKDSAVGSWQIAAFGAVFGLLTVLFQLCYIKAMALGNVSITVMMINFSMVIPIALSVTVYGEKLTPLKAAGIFLTICALVISVDRKEKSKDFKRWFAFSLAAALANGGLAICQKIYGETEFAVFNKQFVAWSYIAASILSAILFLCMNRIGEKITFAIKPSVFLFALAAGVILGIFQALNTKAISNIDGALLFPTYNGGALVLSTLSGVLLLGDKLKRNQIISIAVGITAIILLNI